MKEPDDSYHAFLVRIPTIMCGEGTCIVDLALMRALLKEDACLLPALLTPGEQNYCLKWRNPLPHIAARFAAKRALIEQMRIEEKTDITWTEIDIRSTPEGAPSLTLEKRVLDYARQAHMTSWLVSLTHARQYAGAFVAIETKRG